MCLVQIQLCGMDLYRLHPNERDTHNNIFVRQSQRKSPFRIRHRADVPLFPHNQNSDTRQGFSSLIYYHSGYNFFLLFGLFVYNSHNIAFNLVSIACVSQYFIQNFSDRLSLTLDRDTRHTLYLLSVIDKVQTCLSFHCIKKLFN